MNEPLRIALIGAGVMGRQQCRFLRREPLFRFCANPNTLYVSTVLDCIAAGVPVLLEAVMQAAESGRRSRPALAGEP